MSSSEQPADRSQELSPIFILFLVSVAGMTDASFYLHSKDLLGVYVTGDTSKMAQFLQKGDVQKVLPLLGIIATFLASTTLAAWLGNRLGRYRAPLLLFVVALFILATWPASAPDYPYGVVLSLVVAMGVLNQTCSNEPGVTFITGTLVKLGRGLAGGDFRESFPLALRWLVWFAAAFVGAFLNQHAAPYALPIIAIWCLLLALTSLFTQRVIPQHAASSD
ncbi:YoaK family protein [Rouxiella chamberiensis]|uniref:YoaK family protein n=1 Tax=Rouxiella chamberiensis TaxID=1513468 RepID=A0ABY7HQG2_9GAMM|nr:YoaK family protein [Rouxiella chamberiensis]WAT01625.1 YoaK family protein [Rouxiella chamberiensis]